MTLSNFGRVAAACWHHRSGFGYALLASIYFGSLISLLAYVLVATGEIERLLLALRPVLCAAVARWKVCRPCRRVAVRFKLLVVALIATARGWWWTQE